MLFDLIIEPCFGPIQETFAEARHIATITSHTVIVRGNDVAVAVAGGMDDDACRRAYEAALEWRDAVRRDAAHQRRVESGGYMPVTELGPPPHGEPLLAKKRSHNYGPD